ncbi:MAG: hypothetical protein HY516_01165 [Candidatus Aenigmarchaeota archaeon]|nr:hypothetical protein [Candidatus Aenigmarchaeota archaeon]
MNYTARQIGCEKGPNPAAQYFDFDPDLFNPVRVQSILASGKNATAVFGVETKQGGVTSINSTAVYSHAGKHASVSVFAYHIDGPRHTGGDGFVEISTDSPEYASTGEYRRVVGKIINSGSKIPMDARTVRIVRETVESERTPVVDVMPVGIVVGLIKRKKK